MDKKKFIKASLPEDMKGFEEFIQGQSEDASFLPRPQGTKKETGFEHFTFLSNDANRLNKLKNLLGQKLPFAAKYEQGKSLLKEQKDEISQLQDKIFIELDGPSSSYRKSLSEIFDQYFEQPKA
jgi:hypothetical protein